MPECASHRTAPATPHQAKLAGVRFYSWLHNTPDWKLVSFNYSLDDLTNMLYARLEVDLPSLEVVGALEQCIRLRLRVDEIREKLITNTAMKRIHLQHVFFRKRIEQWLGILKTLGRASSQKSPIAELSPKTLLDEWQGQHDLTSGTTIDNINDVRKHPMIATICLEKIMQYLDEAESHCHQFQSGDANIVKLAIRRFKST
jgi:hypothetical protein